MVPKNIVNVLVKLSSIVEGERGNYCFYDNKMIFMSFTWLIIIVVRILKIYDLIDPKQVIFNLIPCVLFKDLILIWINFFIMLQVKKKKHSRTSQTKITKENEEQYIISRSLVQLIVHEPKMNFKVRSFIKNSKKFFHNSRWYFHLHIALQMIYISELL